MDDIYIALAGFVTTVLASLFSYKAALKHAAVSEISSHAQAQDSLNETMKALVEEMRKDREELREEIARLKNGQEEDNQRIMNLQIEVHFLRAELEKHGITPPPTPAVPSLRIAR
jgi:uncharacterized coiled-coil DUF342 family protein